MVDPKKLRAQQLSFRGGGTAMAGVRPVPVLGVLTRPIPVLGVLRERRCIDRGPLLSVGDLPDATLRGACVRACACLVWRA
jgi:hypothetical protein